MSIKKYKIQECIGKGNFGDVYKAIDRRDDNIVAIKVINLDESDEDIGILVQEIQFLSKLRSPYITKYYETFVNGMSMWIVMEYCGGGSCAELLKCYKKLSEETTGYIIREVLRGLCYLHEEHKVHRDIKLANILLTDEGEVKLADFGVSGEITLTKVKRNTFVGTPFWMAPEVISRQKAGYDEKADIWSTGITTIELVTGSPPLSQYDPMKILFEIPKKRPPQLTGVGYSENIKDFVRYCLIKDPRKRPSSSTLLHHRFIRNIRRNVNLLRLIEEKNRWVQLNQDRLRKKPKYPLHIDADESTDNEMLIKWDFSTKISYPTKDSPMEQTLLMDTRHNAQAILRIDTGSPESPVRSILSQAPVCTSTPTSPASPIKHLTQIEHSESPEVSQELYSFMLAKQNSLSFKFLDDVILYALRRLQLRAKAPSTRNTIDRLMKIFIDYERAQPGLCEAFVEEILMLHVANTKHSN